MRHALRFALSFVQGIMSLFAAGAVIYEAHQLFLWYYAREWEGVIISGVNGCAGEEKIANGDLFSGETLCNQPENLIPWVEVYRHHLVVAAAYYGAIFALLLLIGAIWFLSQRRKDSSEIVNQTPHGSGDNSGTI